MILCSPFIVARPNELREPGSGAWMPSYLVGELLIRSILVGDDHPAMLDQQIAGFGAAGVEGRC